MLPGGASGTKPGGCGNVGGCGSVSGCGSVGVSLGGSVCMLEGVGV